MFKQHPDIAGNPYYSEFKKKSSMSSHLRREKKANTHIWNLYEDHANYPPPSCSFCHIDFNTLLQWHAHMASFIHKEPSLTEAEAVKTHAELLILCKFCQQEVRIKTVKDHRCVLTEITRLEEVINNYNYTYCPLICILCKKVKTFSSQASLQMHIVIRHSPLKDPRRCSLCNAEFRTTDIGVQEAHAVDVHAPELNLLYWKLTESSTSKKPKTEGIKYVCALSYYSNNIKKENISCIDNLTDIFQLTIHTLCFHGFVPRVSILDKKPPEIESVLSSFKINKDLSCRYCGFRVATILQLNEHISASHMLELMLRRDFIIKKRLFLGKIPLNLTCFYCMTLFPTAIELQVHLMVRHGNTEFGFCGMCNLNLLNLLSNDKCGQSHKMHWRAIQYHESCHMQQVRQYNLHGIFNKNIVPSPVLYQSHQEFIEELEKRRNVQSDIILTDEQIAFFKLLGMNNYENQINMEMLAK